MRGCKNLSPKEVLPHGPIMFFKIQLLLYIVYNNLGSHIISSSHHNFFLYILSHKHTRIFILIFLNQSECFIDRPTQYNVYRHSCTIYSLLNRNLVISVQPHTFYAKGNAARMLSLLMH